jgi:hypothetical protein
VLDYNISNKHPLQYDLVTRDPGGITSTYSRPSIIYPGVPAEESLSSDMSSRSLDVRISYSDPDVIVYLYARDA